MNDYRRPCLTRPSIFANGTLNGTYVSDILLQTHTNAQCYVKPHLSHFSHYTDRARDFKAEFQRYNSAMIMVARYYDDIVGYKIFNLGTIRRLFVLQYPRRVFPSKFIGFYKAEIYA